MMRLIESHSENLAGGALKSGITDVGVSPFNENRLPTDRTHRRAERRGCRRAIQIQVRQTRVAWGCGPALARVLGVNSVEFAVLRIGGIKRKRNDATC